MEIKSRKSRIRIKGAEKMNQNQFNQDTLNGMDHNFNELLILLQPIFNNNVKYVNGKALVDIKKKISDIVASHKFLRDQMQ